MESVPNSVVKLIKSLQLKKYRQKEQLFLVEGEKSIRELSRSNYETVFLVGDKEFISSTKGEFSEVNTYTIGADKLNKLSSFKTNTRGIAVAKIPPMINPTTNVGVQLVLDTIKDPGNLGTIIRIADWYGLDSIIVSESTVDQFNPKVISASMGSFLRVQVQIAPLEAYLEKCPGQVLAADMGGKSIHDIEIEKPTTLVIGSESHGLSDSIKKMCTETVSIPGNGGAESLNAAVSGGILLDNIFRAIN